MVLFAAFLALLALLPADAAIRPAKVGEFPFQVSVQTVESRHLCGGAIITPKWVLTAKSCVDGQLSLRIVCGCVDSNEPLNTFRSKKIISQNEFTLTKRNSLALIELDAPIEFSDKVKAAGLPTAKAELLNTTKQSGWKVEKGVSLPPDLYANDVYYTIPKDCKTETGTPINLAVDEFCGVDEDHTNSLLNQGSIVSKSAVVLGLLANPPLIMYQPAVYVKLSEHEDWIRKVLDTDAQHVNWVDVVPKDSATSNAVVSFALIGISTIFLRFI